MDLSILLTLHGLSGKSAFIDALIVFFGSQLQYIVVGALLLWSLVGKNKNPVMAWGAIAAALISRLALTELVRFFYNRPRPFVALQFTPLIAHETSASFPSGHAAFFFGIAWFVYMHDRRLSMYFFIAAILICLARIAVGIHYPTDIIGGAVVGFFGAWTTHKLAKRMRRG